MRIAIAGTGAFGINHLEALRNIAGVDIAAVVSRTIEQAHDVAHEFEVPLATTNLDDVLSRPDIDAIILCTPTPLHARQAIASLRAGKHVQIEIPLADNWKDAQEVATVARASGLICMVGHTRRFNPPHQWLHERIIGGELTLQHLDVQTFFFRRTNINALGLPRSWVDNLLWHHAAHTVDLFAYQCGDDIVDAHVVAGPNHPVLHIPMDMSIHLESESGKICTLALSFNNDGPLGSSFRYICDNGTFIARYDELVTGYDQHLDVSSMLASTNGVELQDREFVGAILDHRDPNSSIESVLTCYRVLGRLQTQLNRQKRH